MALSRARDLLRLTASALVLLTALPAAAGFEADLARVDAGLKKNPKRVTRQALESCLNRRTFALRLYDRGYDVRAERALRACFQLLRIPEVAPVKKVHVPTAEELQARAQKESDKALTLEPDIARGLELYRECAGCHLPEGWGLANGSVPQIAGQHRSVLVKQLADIRAGNRDAVLMVPYAAPKAIGGAQGIADVTAYIDSLEISVETGKGPGDDLARGEQLYAQHCARCHGAKGEGDAKTYSPRIQAQHYNYLVRQFEWIRDGKRRNSNKEMVQQIQEIPAADMSAILDWVSRLEPLEELQAPAGWKNPDFDSRPFEMVKP